MMVIASHISIELIELAHANDINILCLPAHTTQNPMDIGVLSHLQLVLKGKPSVHRKNPGRVITSSVYGHSH